MGRVDKMKKLLLERESLQRRRDSLLETIKQQSEEITALEEALLWVKTVRQQKALEVVSTLETVGKNALRILDPSLDFKVDANFERGTIAFRVLKNGEEYDPKYELGGGILDVVSLALRLGVAILRKVDLLVLDEPLRHLSREYRQKIGELLYMISKEFGIKMLVITHDPDLIVEEDGVNIMTLYRKEAT